MAVSYLTVGQFYERMKESLHLELVAPNRGLKKRIRVPEVDRPGIALAGYFQYFAFKRIQVLGKVEITFLNTLTKEERHDRLKKLLSTSIPCVIVARRYKIPFELLSLSKEARVPIFRSSLITMKVVNKATLFLEDEYSPSTSISGDLVEVFGVGVLIMGKSGVGKSECALGLIHRGHRLVSDDVVKVKIEDGRQLIGFGSQVTRHHMEIRGLGIINVQTLFGAGCVRERKRIDIVVTLEDWDPNKEYDRLGLTEQSFTILGISVPHIVIPVKPGRDMALLVEMASLNQRLKFMGYHSALEFNNALISKMKQ